MTTDFKSYTRPAPVSLIKAADGTPTELAPIQQAQLEKERQFWMKVGWASQPCDRPATEAAITKFYAESKLKAPRYYWVSGPKEAQKVIAVLREYEKFPSDEELARKVAAMDKGPYVSQTFSGGMESYWVGYHEFCRWLGVAYDSDSSRLLDIWGEYVRAGGWVWCFEHAVICSERPSIASHNDAGELHSETGPAVAFADGTKIYAINGVIIDDPAIIERPDTITVARIDKEDNAELKRIMIERMGVAKYLHETGAKVIDMDMRPLMKGEAPTIPRGLVESKDGRRFLVGTDGSQSTADGKSARVYYMEVPRTCKTCVDAHLQLNGNLSESKCLGQS